MALNESSTNSAERKSDDPILQKLKKKQIKKGTLLLVKGGKAKEAYHILTGCLRSYAMDENGKEHIIQFAPEGWYISDMDSFFNGEDAIISIDAIEDSEVLVFEKAMLKEIEQFPKEVILRQLKMGQNNIIALNKRLISLLSSRAEDRYIGFVETYPSLVQRLPLKMIASYLGITPEFLSRLRKKISRR